MKDCECAASWERGKVSRTRRLDNWLGDDLCGLADDVLTTQSFNRMLIDRCDLVCA